MKNLQGTTELDLLRKKELELTAIYHVSGNIKDMDELISCKMEIVEMISKSIGDRDRVIEELRK